MDLKEYLDTQNNLPEWMRDFHDQKDLFKAIYEQWKGKGDNKVLDDVSWVDAHVFTVDFFLWWMGLHGYKLQKIRAKDIEFYDPEETINHYTRNRKGLFDLLKEGQEP